MNTRFILMALFVASIHTTNATNNFPSDLIEKNDNISIKIMDLKVNDEGVISWRAQNEGEKIPFAIQQFKWGKWTTVKKVEGKGGEEWNDYTEKVALTSGQNKFRVVRYNMFSSPTISEDFIIESKKLPVNATYNNNKKIVSFSYKTFYQIKDISGKILLEGFEKSINLTTLASGKYIVEYDNSAIEVQVK
ncbi:MAG: hypothetical protein ACLGGV_02285 [Bacteroidia bacterium]